MRGAWMIRIAREDRRRDGACLLTDRQGRISTRHRRQQCERVESLRFVVRGILRGHSGHRLRVGGSPCRLVAWSEERISGAKESLLAGGPRLGEPGVGGAA